MYADFNEYEERDIEIAQAKLDEIDALKKRATEKMLEFLDAEMEQNGYLNDLDWDRQQILDYLPDLIDDAFGDAKAELQNKIADIQDNARMVSASDYFGAPSRI